MTQFSQTILSVNYIFVFKHKTLQCTFRLHFYEWILLIVNILDNTIIACYSNRLVTPHVQLNTTIEHLFTILILKFIVSNNCNKIYCFSFQSIAAV